MGDLDRRKHDVDIIERVLGGIRDTDAGERTRVVDVDVPWVSGSSHRTLELTVGVDHTEADHRRAKG